MEIRAVFCWKPQKIHIQECTEKKDNILPHSCIFCGSKFSTSAGLRVHMSFWCKEKFDLLGRRHKSPMILYGEVVGGGGVCVWRPYLPKIV